MDDPYCLLWLGLLSCELQEIPAAAAAVAASKEYL
jgi:hypothetical protein